MVTAINPSNPSTEAALRLLGGRNDGTPLATASTPVSAAQPDEKARVMIATSTHPKAWSAPWAPITVRSEVSLFSECPRTRIRKNPMASIKSIENMKT